MFDDDELIYEIAEKRSRQQTELELENQMNKMDRLYNLCRTLQALIPDSKIQYKGKTEEYWTTW